MAINTTFSIYSSQDQLGGVDEFALYSDVQVMPTITGLNPLYSYTIEYSGSDPDNIELTPYSRGFTSTTDQDNLGYTVTLSKQGDYTVDVVITEVETGLTSTYEVIIPASEFITFDYIACDTFSMSNKSTTIDATYGIKNVQGDTIVESTALAANTSATITFEEIGLFIVSVDYNETHTEYVLNTFCKLDACFTAFIEDLLCQDTRDCTCEYDSSAEVKVIRMFALKETYFMKLQSEYGFNNKYSALTDTKLDELATIDQVLAKIAKMCDRTYCLDGGCGDTSKLTVNSDCGCS